MKHKTGFGNHCILIEGAGTATAISVIKGLSEPEVQQCKTVMVDADDFVAGRYFADKFYKTPSSKDEKYIEFMLDICKKEGVDIYIPIIDYGFEKLSNNKQKFKDSGIYLMIADYPSIKICADKYLTYTYFINNNIPTPKTFEFKNHKNISYDKSYIMKPRSDGRASLDVHKISSLQEVESVAKDNTNYIIQEFITGKEFTADCLNNLDGTMFINAVIRERVETKGGLATKARIFDKILSDKIKVYLKKISEGLRLPGVYNIQGFIKNNEEIYFTEINPRFAGTHVMNIKAGVNSIHFLLQMIDGIPPEKIQKSININHNIRMLRYWNEIFIDGDLSDGEVSAWNHLLKKH